MNTCVRCGAHAQPGQEYCLDCGSRLPGYGRFAPPRELGQGWALRAGAALVVALVGLAVAVAAADDRGEEGRLVTATGGFATAPDTSTVPSGPARAGGIVEWPPGEDGWTIALASIPQTAGRRAAVTRARQARRRGLEPVGILDSSRYASLHPGYWIVFAGIYTSEAEATSALEPARRASRTATVRRVVP